MYVGTNITRSFQTFHRCSNKNSYYDVLKIPVTASPSEIKTAFYACSKRLHPDKTGSQNIDEFLSVKQAYEVLGNSRNKAYYDCYLGSFERQQYSYSEWCKRGMNLKYGGVDQKVRTDQDEQRGVHGLKMERGVDAKWSDFGISDLLLLSFVVGFSCYVYFKEKEKSKRAKLTKRSQHW